MENTIQIKNWETWKTDSVIFEHTCENNTIKTTVEEAVKRGVDLSYANLEYANLVGANLIGVCLKSAYLEGANLKHANLENAYLEGALLYKANLVDANLHKANLVNANLVGANLEKTNLKHANLENAYLEGANLEKTNLKHANLENAYLEGAILYNAYLKGANLKDAILYNADLYNAKINFPIACPSEGSFIGWKKVENDNSVYLVENDNSVYLVKLEIPENAKRSSATTKKCRCEFAKVLEITDLHSNINVDEVVNYNHFKTVYKVGEMVYPDSWDESRWNECSHGIHFFVDKQDAINW